MRKLLFIVFLCQGATVFSQGMTGQPAVTDAHTFGYVDGIRMDSLNAEYAQFEWRFEKLLFNYGESSSRKRTTVTDEKGNPFVFGRQSISFTLNFLYFNGWQFAQPYYNYEDKTDIFIVKKIHNP